MSDRAHAIEMADEIRRAFDPKSPLAFVSDHHAPEQHFVGVHRGRAKRGLIVFPKEALPEARHALFKELRIRGHVVSDLANAKRMTPALKAIYGQDKSSAFAMGLDIPDRLKCALILTWREEGS